MKNVTRIAALAALVGFVGVVPARADVWTIDSFSLRGAVAVRHLMVSTVRGDFGGVQGTVEFDGKDAKTLKVDATIDVATVNTREAKRDEHLRSADFFDVAKSPKITFKSKSAEAAGPGKIKVVGDLTLKGVTKEVVLMVAGPSRRPRARGARRSWALSASTKINRTDFGLTWNKALETGGVLVGEEVAITIDMELVKKEAAPAAK